MSPPPEHNSSRALTLHSVVTGLSLKLSNMRADYYTAELNSPEFRIQRDIVSGYFFNDEKLTTFFDGLAMQEKPWAGEKKWHSLESALLISATCTILGQVTFDIVIRKLHGSMEEWEFRTKLQSELGQLPILATAAKIFFEADIHAS